MDISYYDDNNNSQYETIAWVTKNEDRGDLMTVTSNIDVNDNNNKILLNPFEIYIEVKSKFLIRELPSYYDETEHEFEPETELEPEDEEPVSVSKPFKTDQCVVCLSKEPSVLFLECLHYCVCLECEEANPFRKCPSCRTRIGTKVMI